MANVEPTEDPPEEAVEELESGAAAAAAYGQPGLALAGGIGSLAAGAAARELADEADATEREYPGGNVEDHADAGNSFAGEGNPRPEAISEDKGIDAGPAIQKQG